VDPLTQRIVFSVALVGLILLFGGWLAISRRKPSTVPRPSPWASANRPLIDPTDTWKEEWYVADPTASGRHNRTKVRICPQTRQMYRHNAASGRWEQWPGMVWPRQVRLSVDEELNR
jgi:hypothetical protein